MSELVEKLFAVHDSLTAGGLAHAFGGAIALAYCVKEPRGTRDLDVNIFTASGNAKAALDSLPRGVAVGDEDTDAVRRDGQTRLWWDDTPIDVFLNNLPLHDSIAAGVRWVPLAGREVPVLDCVSLAIFKAFFDRTKDWADLERIAETAPGDIESAAATVARLVGADDSAVARLESLL